MRLPVKYKTVQTLDTSSFVGTHCNYQITNNDKAWNEYIKKGQVSLTPIQATFFILHLYLRCYVDGDFIEFGEFKSPTSRGPKQWPALPPHPSPSSSESNGANGRLLSDVQAPTTSRRNSTEERRQRKIVTAQRALILAETDVSKAMELVREAMPVEFMAHSSWYINDSIIDFEFHSSSFVLPDARYLTTFNYVRLQAQRKLCQTMMTDTKKYQWPISFPDCTPELRSSSIFSSRRWPPSIYIRRFDQVKQWTVGFDIISLENRVQNVWFWSAQQAQVRMNMKHRFNQHSCLSLYLGKTSFALSLPGMVNYFKGRWHLDNWNPLARYCVFDDIGWDNFEKMNYPSKKDLLTQNGLTGVSAPLPSSISLHVCLLGDGQIPA